MFLGISHKKSISGLCCKSEKLVSFETALKEKHGLFKSSNLDKSQFHWNKLGDLLDKTFRQPTQLTPLPLKVCIESGGVAYITTFHIDGWV